MTVLSVIIPTYNSSGTIERCLSSLAQQKFRDFEVCIIDGGSTDSTIPIAETFSSSLNLKIISEDDSGIYDAMNKGILQSSGSWLYFLGSDDQIYSENVFNLIFTSKSVDENEVVYGNVNSPRFHGIYDGPFNPDKLYKKNICHQAIFLKKTVFKKTGLFNLDNKVYADWEHNMRWFYDRTIRKDYINIVVANYADGGYSSNCLNTYFLKDKRKLVLSKGFFEISILLKLKIFSKISLEAIYSLNYKLRDIYNSIIFISKN